MKLVTIFDNKITSEKEIELSEINNLENFELVILTKQEWKKLDISRITTRANTDYTSIKQIKTSLNDRKIELEKQDALVADLIRAKKLFKQDASDDTYTHIFKPSDSRCAWWSIKLPENLSEHHLTEKVSAPFLKNGSDIEIKSGEIYLESEANHHRNNRGYRVRLVFVVKNENDELELIKLVPNIEHKKYIKKAGFKNFMNGSGDVAGCVRIALFLKSDN